MGAVDADRAGMLAVVRQDIEDCKAGLEHMRAALLDAEADLAAAERYALFLERILDARGSADDALVERLNTQRSIEDAILIIASESPDKCVTSERANRLVGLAGIGTQGAVYSVLSRTKAFDKVGRGVYRLKSDWKGKRGKSFTVNGDGVDQVAPLEDPAPAPG